MNKSLMIDPLLKSWIPYDAESDFPIQNLPLGIFSAENESKKVCTIIGDTVIDIAGLVNDQLINGSTFLISDFHQGCLNPLLEKGKGTTRALRLQLSKLFDASNNDADRDKCSRHFYKQGTVRMHLPVKVANYTDFYSSKEHATNVGTMFRDPANALLPNWLHMPVGYHGRASSIVVSGTDIIRPKGQMLPQDAEVPVFGASKLLDIELEMAFVIGKGNPLGHPIPVDQAEDHIQGLVLFNDWSARDIQKWEYVPLGPFLGKNFASTVSPWLIDLDALQHFKVHGPEPEKSQLDYLKTDAALNYDIHLEVILQTPNGDQNVICKSNMKYLYWNMSQQLAHHTVNGCNMETGDMCASGTISGPDPESYGSMLELAWKGTKPLLMKDGSTRVFLKDGDTIILKAHAQHDNYRIGFGEARGKILPAL
jgi:fumarylacetoacetase